MQNEFLKTLSPERPALIAGPTASGKSALALAIADAQGGVIVNADALQVYSNWRILSARPSVEDEINFPHRLYGHVSREIGYSVGHWLRDLDPVLSGSLRPIIVGGTGLYFAALTTGLADIPAISSGIREKADTLLVTGGLDMMLRDLDPTTRERIDTANPMRVQRAWEVWQMTGQGLADWQDNTPAPLLPIEDAQPILMNANRDWLADRIETRFRNMVTSGALDEACANLRVWDQSLPSSKAIGAPKLIDHLLGKCSLDGAIEAGIIATRQYAKRQRTWFRSKMKGWRAIELP